MTTQEVGGELQFEAPGPGSWTLDAVHFPRPLTRYWRETHPEPFVRGFRETTSFYGTLLGGLEYRYVNGFAYSTMRLAPEDEIPQRFQRADEVFEKKLWRQQLEEWDTKFKPESIQTHRAIQAVDPGELSGDELVAYLRRCRDHHP